MAEIGTVSACHIKSTNSFGETVQTKILGAMNPEATYTEVDTANRALIGLTKNTYDDTVLTTEISVNEKLAEE